MHASRLCFLLMASAAVMLGVPASAATLKVGIQDDPDALDPATSGTYTGRLIFTAMCDKLVDIDKNLKIVPQLATEWKWADDDRSLTLTLRDEVTFQDGTPFDAEAVKFNIERMQTMKDSKRKGELSSITSVEALDKTHVRLDLKEPFVPMLAVLSDRAGMMVSPAAAKKGGDDFATDPVCSGPYKLTERRARDVINLEKYDGYWDADEFGYDELSYVYVPDSTVRLSRLQAGDLDVAERMSPTDLDTIRSSDRMKLYTSPGLAVSHLMVNVGAGDKAKTPLGQEPKLRQALEAVLDRNVINQVAFNGTFVPDNQMIPPSSAYHSDASPIMQRDVAKAKALIEEAGGDPGPIEITYENSLSDGRVAQIVQSLASEAGFDIKLLPLETTSAIQSYLSGDFQVYIGNWSGRADPDPTLFAFFSCEGSQNVNGYCNKELEDVLVEARKTFDETKRKALYDEATKIYLADLPTIPLYHSTWFIAAVNSVQGIDVYPDGLLRLRGVKPAAE